MTASLQRFSTTSPRRSGLLGNRSGAAAFLGYHSVADDGPAFLSIPPETFERQLATLKRLGWGSGTSQDLGELLTGRRPRRQLAFLTFDDGFADNASTALPLLRRYGLKPIVFVLPPCLEHGSALSWPEVAERRRAHPRVMRSMDWAAVEAMAEAGAEIGSHGLTHRSMPALDPAELREELVESRRALRERLGRCDVVAYPFGHWSSAVAAAAADAGYRYAFTIPRNGQRPAGPYAIPRMPVDHRDDERRFRLKLSRAGRSLFLSPLVPAARALARRHDGRPPAKS